MNIWFSSDYHLGHENIIKYCNRPFKDAEEMDRVIIDNHNSVVAEDDLFYFLGDFCFSGHSQCLDYVSKLNGNKIFVRGNHDRHTPVRSPIRSLTIKIDENEYYCVHKPSEHNQLIQYNLVGHIHEKWKFLETDYNVLINVGCDVWNFKPVSAEEIRKEYWIWHNKQKEAHMA